MNIFLSEITEQYKRKDLPEVKIGDKLEVVTNHKSREKSRLTTFKGIVIGKKNPKQISYTFTLVYEGKFIVSRGIFSYHSPSIVSIKIIPSRKKYRRSKLNFLERRLSAKK